MADPREDGRGMAGIARQAAEDAVHPNEYVRRVIQSALFRGSFFIKPDSKYVVMGIDGLDGQFFPCGSSRTLKDIRALAREKIESEPHGPHTASASFHIFTREGVPVSLVEEPKPKHKKQR